MECTICHREIGEVEDAVAEGWVPYFYDGDEEFGPACSDCVKAYLRYNENDWEWEVKKMKDHTN